MPKKIKNEDFDIFNNYYNYLYRKPRKRHRILKFIRYVKYIGNNPALLKRANELYEFFQKFD